MGEIFNFDINDLLKYKMKYGNEQEILMLMNDDCYIAWGMYDDDKSMRRVTSKLNKIKSDEDRIVPYSFEEFLIHYHANGDRDLEERQIEELYNRKWNNDESLEDGNSAVILKGRW